MRIRYLGCFDNITKEPLIKEISNTIILSDGTEIENTEESIRAHNENSRKAKERYRAEQNQKINDNQTGKLCPVDRFADFEKECKKECALYLDEGCSMKRKEAVTDTYGKPCPYMRKCIKECALYENGCTM